eukprot:2986860-Prymnesium_polylepis.1
MTEAAPDSTRSATGHAITCHHSQTPKLCSACKADGGAEADEAWRICPRAVPTMPGCTAKAAT